MAISLGIYPTFSDKPIWTNPDKHLWFQPIWHMTNSQVASSSHSCSWKWKLSEANRICWFIGCITNKSIHHYMNCIPIFGFFNSPLWLVNCQYVVRKEKHPVFPTSCSPWLRGHVGVGPPGVMSRGVQNLGGANDFAEPRVFNGATQQWR
jgi:hypothetical protein